MVAVLVGRGGKYVWDVAQDKDMGRTVSFLKHVRSCQSSWQRWTSELLEQSGERQEAKGSPRTSSMRRGGKKRKSHAGKTQLNCGSHPVAFLVVPHRKFRWLESRDAEVPVAASSAFKVSTGVSNQRDPLASREPRCD